MASTNKTVTLELSQFVGTDIPGWLTDYNSDMSKIDAFAAEANSDISDAVQKANSANTTAQAASTAANQAVTSAGQANTGVATINSKNSWVKSIISGASAGIFSSTSYTQYYNEFTKMLYVTGEGTIKDGVEWPSNGYVDLGVLNGLKPSSVIYVSNGAYLRATSGTEQVVQTIEIGTEGILYVYVKTPWPSPTGITNKRIQVSFCIPFVE